MSSADLHQLRADRANSDAGKRTVLLRSLDVLPRFTAKSRPSRADCRSTAGLHQRGSVKLAVRHGATLLRRAVASTVIC